MIKSKGNNGAILSIQETGMNANEKLFEHKFIVGSIATAGVRTVCIDPENEYSKLAEMLGGEAITINSNSGTYINPFKLDNYSVARKEICEKNNYSITDIHQSLNDLDIKEISLEGLNEEKIHIKLNEIYNELKNKKTEHPKVKFYENKAKLFLASKMYSKTYKMLHKAKKYRKIDYKPTFMIDEAFSLLNKTYND